MNQKEVMSKLMQISLQNPEFDEKVLLKYTNTHNNKCGYYFKKGDVSFKCMTCSDNVQTVFCHSCFMNSSHDGHLWRARMKSAPEGQCDCGNSIAFKPSSFCSDHQYSENNPFKNMKQTELTELLINCFGFVASIHLNKCSEQFLKTVQGSEIIQNAASIVVFLSGENDITLQNVVENIIDFNYIIREGKVYDGQNQESFFGMMCKIQNPSEELNLLYGEILPSCLYCKVAAIRQIGPYAQIILNNANQGIYNNLVQTLSEPMGLYYDWGFCDTISDIIFTRFQEHITNNNLAGMQEVMTILQANSFNDCLTTWRSILFKSKKYLANCVKMQQILIQQYSLNPNEQVVWSQDIVNKFASHMYFYNIMFADRGWQGYLKIGQTADVKLLSEAHMKRNCVDASLLQQETYDHLIEQAKYMLQAYLETFVDFDLLDQKPLQSIPSIYIQQFIVDVAIEYQVSIKSLILLIITCISDLNEEEVVQMLVEPIIRQNLWYLYVENNLMHKQNAIDFGRFMNYFEQDICNKIPQFNSYFVVSKFLHEYPVLINDIILNVFTKNFSDHPIIIVDYVSILNFIPRPQFNQNFLSKLIINQDFKKYTLQGILDKAFPKYYTCEDVYAVLRQLYQHTQFLNPNESDTIVFKGFSMFEPVLFIGVIDSILQNFTEKQNKFFVPECVYNITKDTNDILKHFDQQYLQNICDTVIQQYNNQETGLGQCLMAVRIMIQQNFSISHYSFRQPELGQLLQHEIQASQASKPTLNPKERFQQLKKQKQQETTLMDQGKVDKLEYKLEIICETCHQKIENDDFVMPYRRIKVKSDLTMHDGVQVCYHHYHKQCATDMEKCDLCGFECDGVMSFDDEQVIAEQIHIQLSLINYFSRFNLSPAASRRLQNEVQKLQLFLEHYNGNDVDIVSFKQTYLQMGDRFVSDFVSFRQKSEEIVQTVDIHLPKSSYYIFKAVINQHCTKCSQECTLSQHVIPQYQNPLMCLGCGTYSHFNCSVSDNEYSCPACNYPYCLSLRTLTLFHSPSQIIKAPYKTKFGQYILNIFDDENILQTNVDYYYISLCCGDTLYDSKLLEAIGFKFNKSKFQRIIDFLQRQGVNISLEQLNNMSDQQIQALLGLLEQNEENNQE
ncbi:Putative_zinc finger in N-recognin (UBR box) and ring finger domain-containing protein [Hexamita inflata]|uniref:E3 ubiquitin-protein ligase n=1 Tax=Hexamita inflata TaxID=28002 RepID=A0AA86NUP0_9EUKA|nr:Putative zinc finger in N-recognin (UBR box) and ring finger domain-containing protein [Hexamita inflata]